MTNFGFINLLPRHTAVDLKFDTNKVQRKAPSIRFICKTLLISYSTFIIFFISSLQTYRVYLGIYSYTCPNFELYQSNCGAFSVIFIIPCSSGKHY